MSEGPAMPDVASRRRPRFAFRLRTLFAVVTILCALLGWIGVERRFIQARRAAVARLERAYQNRDGGSATPYPMSKLLDWKDGGWRSEMDTPSVPRLRRWLGDVPYGVVNVPAAWPESEVRNLRYLFPEAYIYWARNDLHRAHQRRLIELQDVGAWIQSVERKLNVSVPAEDVPKIKTVDDAVRYAAQKRAASGREIE
jgi:hypothetical protein